jgi:serine/threonine protein kinase
MAVGKSLTGTARYASINALRGLEQSRRDDIEALGYCLLYFLNGSLPWMGLDAKDRKQKYERICEVKAGTSLETLCGAHPPEFITFLRHVRSLPFEEAPPYQLYRQRFRELFLKLGYVYDYEYDWAEGHPTGAGSPPRTPDVHGREIGGSNGAVVPSSAISREEKTVSDDQPPIAHPPLPHPPPDLPRPAPRTPPEALRKADSSPLRKTPAAGWTQPPRRQLPSIQKPQ